MSYNDPTNVTTGEARLSYVHLFEPYANQPDQEPKYSTTILVPKTDTDTKARIDYAIEAAKQKGADTKWNGVIPPIVQTPIYDGDAVRPSDGMPFGDECKGCWVFTARSTVNYPPEVVDSSLNPIITPSEMYSGVYARVNVTFFPYSYGGKKGIGCSLGPVAKTRDGDALGGSRPKAASVFAEMFPQAQSQPQQVPPAQQNYRRQGYTGGYSYPQQVPPAQQNYSQPQQTPPAQQSYPQAGYAQPQQGAVNPITGRPYSSDYDEGLPFN